MDGDEHHRCDYILRAERINSYPNGPELVWFDSIQDDNNTALPLFVFATELNQQSSLALLCDEYPVLGFDAERFWVNNEGDRLAETSHSLGECLAGLGANFLFKLTFLGKIVNAVNGP